MQRLAIIVLLALLASCATAPRGFTLDVARFDVDVWTDDEPAGWATP